MQNTQSTKPQSFRTGDGWFADNLITKPAQMEEETKIQTTARHP